MARAREALFGQSLMERLEDSQAWPTTQASSLRMLKEAIRGDLEAILNTRRHMGGKLDDYPLAAASVLNYGIEELSSSQSAQEGYFLHLQDVVQRCLLDYEPRLTAVSVSVEGGESNNREIRLHIEARLRVSPQQETIHFDTVFDVASETYSVGR